MDLNVSAIVLAAGASRRFGASKALTPIDGRPAALRVSDTLVAAGVDTGVIVLGADTTELRPRLESSPYAIVRNPDPAAGRTGSIQIGLIALARSGGAAADPVGADGRNPAIDRAVLIWPVDRPLASLETVRSLLRAAVTGDADWYVPFHEGRGHPIVLAPSVLGGLAAAPPERSLRELLTELGARRHDVPVSDELIHANLDTPGDLERWRARGKGLPGDER
ncbi:MAG: NTP transferase domain-containing protein [Gemmatimonadetes bacterium]|nr:NTP transferase domain-containing protein [Gemmatimonadota bacterium]